MSQASANVLPHSSQVRDVPPEQKLMDLVHGPAVLQCVHAAIELGTFDILSDSPTSVEDVASRCSAPTSRLYRLLRGLAAVGIVHEHADRRFSLSATGRLLRSDVPGSFAALVRLNGAPWLGDAYRQLAHSVCSGESGFRKLHGKPLFEWLAEHPAEGRLFGEGMSTFSASEVELVLNHYDFSAARHVVDVGGGQGLLLSRILQAVPAARGTLFDRPEVLVHADAHLGDELAERCQRVPGDFFETVVEGGDLYVLKHILHDWEDEAASRIVATVSRAMKPGARLLVIEQGIAPPGVPNPGKVLDLIMLALVEGKERTVDEHAALMTGAGLHFEREIPTPGPITLYEGVR